MLRLDIPAEPFWIDAPYGVRLHVRPLTTALNHAAMARAARRLRALREVSPEDPRLTDPDVAAGALREEATVALGEILILAWEGVGAAEGDAAAPVTPENIRKLLAVPEIEQAFDRGLVAPLARVTAEGNA
jgi:hypothetical protein